MVAGVPKRGARVVNLPVRIYRVYSHGGEVRFEFRHGSGWAGRFAYDDIMTGRVALLNGATKREWDPKSEEKDQPGAAQFDVVIESAMVAWVGGSADSYVIFDEVEKPTIKIPPPKTKPKGSPPVASKTSPPASGQGSNPNPPRGAPAAKTVKEEEEDARPARVIVGHTDRGAPVPDTDDWMEALRGR